MARWLSPALSLSGAATLLWATYALASLLVRALGLPLPANLVGMFLLLGLLWSGLIRAEQLERLTTPLLRHLTLLFVPYAVGLAAWGGLIRASGVALLACLVLSAGIGFAAGGWGAQLASRVSGGRDAPPS